MHSHLRLREQRSAVSPTAFIRYSTYSSDHIKRLKLERLLEGHGEELAPAMPECFQHVPQ